MSDLTPEQASKVERLEAIVDRELGKIYQELYNTDKIVLTQREYEFAKALMRAAYGKGVVDAGSKPKLLYDIRQLGYGIA